MRRGFRESEINSKGIRRKGKFIATFMPDQSQFEWYTIHMLIRDDNIEREIICIAQTEMGGQVSGVSGGNGGLR